ncbi:hypothetical protein ACHQM5_026826 [Ranunculus cassubicifolius]
MVNSDSETESPSSSSSSGDDENVDKYGLNLGGETQRLYFDEETEKLEYDDENENVMMMTQLVVDDSEGEGTDKTEVLSDGESDGGFSEKVDGEGGKDCVDSHVVVSTDCNDAGSEKRRSMSVFSSPVKGSGQSAAPNMALKEMSNIDISFPNNVLSNMNHLNKDEGKDGLRDPILDGIQVKEADPHSNLENLDGYAKSVARNLFNEDASVVNITLANDDNRYDGVHELDLPDSSTCDPVYAGLSYVDSQEPGEFSQANALNVVDRYLAVNHVDILSEDGCAKTLNVLSPPVSRTKGTHILARSSVIKSPVRDVRIYEWADSSEDEGCRDFSEKKKGMRVRRKCHDQNSLTQFKKPRSSNRSKGKCISSNSRKKSSSIHHQKLRSSAGLDTRALHNSEQNAKMVQISEPGILKNTETDFNERVSTGSLEKLREASGNDMDLPDAYEIGLDTQIAAEAMEGLCQGNSPHQIIDNTRALRNSEYNAEMVQISKPGILMNIGTDLNERVSAGFLEKPREAYGNEDLPDAYEIGFGTQVAAEAMEALCRGNSPHQISDNTRVLHNSEQNAKMLQISEPGILKNIETNLSERVSTGSLEKPREAPGNGMDLPDAYEIGFDTQIAAEAMDALCQGNSPHQITDNTYQAPKKVNCGSTRVVTKSDTTHVYARKRFFTDFRGTESCSKRARTIDAAIDDAQETRPHEDMSGMERKAIGLSDVKRKSQKTESKADRHSSVRISLGGKKDMRCGSPEAFQNRKKRGAVGKLKNKDFDKCDNLEVSVGRLHEKSGSFTPISCRTRQAEAEKPSTPMVLSNGSGVANDLMEGIRCRNNRKGNHSGVDAPITLTKLGSSKVGKAGRCEKIQVEESTRKEKCDSQTYSIVKRNCRKMWNSSKDDDADKISTVAYGHLSHEQYIPRRKRSKLGARGSSRVKSHTEWGRNIDAISSLIPKSSNRSVIVGNCANGFKTPPPICLAQKSTSSKTTPNPASKISRKLGSLADVRLLLSQHLDEDIIKQQKKISSRFGLSIVSSASEASHFIADKFVRTRNMLEAIAFGKPVVTHLWLKDCGKANSFVDEMNYLLRDVEKEKEIGFTMPVSLARARACQGQLLQGKIIFITPNVKPSRELVASLATTVHGQVVKRIGRSAMKGDKISDDLLVLSCEEDYAICLPLLLKRVAVYSAELLLSGIIIQKLEFERHRLFKDRGKTTDCVKRQRYG